MPTNHGGPELTLFTIELLNLTQPSGRTLK
jgi:hypothetical protein